LVREAAKTRTLRFETLSPKREDKLRGLTYDRTPVAAAVTLVFRLSPMDLGIGHALEHLQERCSIAVMLFIQAAPDYPTLELRKHEHEAELYRMGIEGIRGLQSVEVEYRRE
jgi:hypothetical protein